MYAIIDCTEPAPACATDAEAACLVDLLGKPMLTHVCDALADAGVERVVCLADSGAARLLELTADGTPWGFQLEVELVYRHQVIERRTELVRALDDQQATEMIVLGQGHVLPRLDLLADRLPRVFRSTRQWTGWMAAPTGMLSAIAPEQLAEQRGLAWLRHHIDDDANVLRSDRERALLMAVQTVLAGRRADVHVGGFQVQPGVWVGPGTKIAATAQVSAPAWIGSHVHIGEQVRISPFSAVGDHTWVDRDSHIDSAMVMPACLVSAGTRLIDSVAGGRAAVDGIASVIAQPPGHVSTIINGALDRVAAGLLMVAGAVPFLIALIVTMLSDRRPPLVAQPVVIPLTGGAYAAKRVWRLRTSPNAPSAVATIAGLPLLWAVVCGHLRLRGVPGIDPSVFRQYDRPIRRRYLSAPIALPGRPTHGATCTTEAWLATHPQRRQPNPQRIAA